MMSNIKCLLCSGAGEYVTISRGNIRRNAGFIPCPVCKGKAQVVDFHCSKCAAGVDTAPMAPDKALCQKCCVEHEYKFDDISRERRCKYCDRVREWSEE